MDGWKPLQTFLEMRIKMFASARMDDGTGALSKRVRQHVHVPPTPVVEQSHGGRTERR